MARRKQHKKHAALIDLSDHELLHFVSDNDGYDTYQMCEVLEVAPKSLGTRMHWMKKYGLVMRDEKGGWWISPEGKQALKSGILVEISLFARDAAASEKVGRAMRREWQRELQLGRR